MWVCECIVGGGKCENIVILKDDECGYRVSC